MVERELPQLPEIGWVTCPGDQLAGWLEWSHLHASIGKLYGIDERTMIGLLNGDEPVTEELARKLLNLTHIPTPVWLALEHNYRAGLGAGLIHSHGERVRE